MSSPKSKDDKKKKNLLDAMGAFFSSQVERRKLVTTQKQALATLFSSSGDCAFPGSDHRPTDRKTWMSELGPERLCVYQVVWPGSHDSATNKIGIPFITRPFAQCQSLSVYEQLAVRCRVIDVCVQEERRVCHGVLATYSVDVVLADVKRFLAETVSELVVLGAHRVRPRGPAGVRQVPVGAARGGEPDPPGRRRVLEDRRGGAAPACDLRVKAAQVAGAGALRATVERGVPEGQLDRHGPAGDQVREQPQVPRAAAERDRPAVLVPGGEHGDAVGVNLVV